MSAVPPSLGVERVGGMAHWHCRTSHRVGCRSTHLCPVGRWTASAPYNLGDYTGALSDYDHAIAIDPKDATAYYDRGIDRSYSGDDRGSIADYNTAIHLNPTDPDPYYERGIARPPRRLKLGTAASHRPRRLRLAAAAPHPASHP